MRPGVWTAALCATCVVVAVAVAGCAGQPAAPAVASAPWVHARLRFAPNPPIARQDDALAVTLTSPGGQSLDGASVTVRPAMRDMEMPRVLIHLADQGGGVYTGKMLPVMGGAWVAAISVTAASQTAVLQIPFRVRS